MFATRKLLQHGLKGRLLRGGVKQVTNGGMSHGVLRRILRPVALMHFFGDVSGRKAWLERQRADFAPCGFHFFTSGDEVRPIRALHQHVGQNLRDQFARRIFVEQRDGIHGFDL